MPGTTVPLNIKFSSLERDNQYPLPFCHCRQQRSTGANFRKVLGNCNPKSVNGLKTQIRLRLYYIANSIDFSGHNEYRQRVYIKWIPGNLYTLLSYNNKGLYQNSSNLQTGNGVLVEEVNETVKTSTFKHRTGNYGHPQENQVAGLSHNNKRI